jgi:hypothetical protein
MIKLFSLIFYLYPKRTRGRVFVVNPTPTPKSRLRHNSKSINPIMNQ